MLLGFKVKNYKSFKNLQYFSLIAGKVRNFENHITMCKDKKVLKFSGMYGANGSGKSNLISAIEFGKILLEKNCVHLSSDLYYRGVQDGKSKSSYFEYELFINNKLYSYGFEINLYKKEIISEWLIDMSKKKEKIIFERDVKKNVYNTNIKDNKHINFINCLDEMKGNNQILFLSEMIRRLVMSQNYDNYFEDIYNVYEFIMRDIIVIRPTTHKLFNLDYIKNKDKILRILNALDIDISDYLTEESDWNKIKLRLSETDYSNVINDIEELSMRYKRIRYTLRIENDIYIIEKHKDGTYKAWSLKFLHNGNNNSFGPYEESDGTIRVLELVDILLTDGKLFLIDELDSSLHPVLVYGLLKIFLNSNTTNQLIVTTHELKTLDFDLVRRDEIWFSEKDNKGSSKIYSLEEYKDVARFDKRIDKAYMEGRFGAIANININYKIFEKDK